MHAAHTRGVVLSWEGLKRDFFPLVGAHYSRYSHDAVSALARNMARHTNKQSVTDYRLALDVKLREVGHILPDSLLMQWFVQGLSTCCRLLRQTACCPQSRIRLCAWSGAALAGHEGVQWQTCGG
jgi:hypothetical protein